MPASRPFNLAQASADAFHRPIRAVTAVFAGLLSDETPEPAAVVGTDGARPAPTPW